MVGTGNENHGIYDSKKGGWVLSAGTANTWSLDGNAATATKWASAQKVYVNLASASTTTTIQGGSSSASAIGVDGKLPIANGGTGNNSGYIQTGLKEGTSIGTRSTAEGYNNQASGKQAHVEGYNNKALSNYSHAEGYNTTASGSVSHAEGTSTVAGYANQHVSGKFNNNKNSTLLEVGNGTSTSNKSNAFEVHEDGYISTGEQAKIKFGKNANDE